MAVIFALSVYKIAKMDFFYFRDTKATNIYPECWPEGSLSSGQLSSINPNTPILLIFLIKYVYDKLILPPIT